VVRILCVDDEADIREDIAYELIEAGYEVNEAGFGQEALSTVQKVKPDLVLCDVSMPVMDGRQFLSEFREKFPNLCDVPFVFLSALSNPKDMIVGKKLGADDYILKPVDYGVLLATIESRLEQVGRMKVNHEKNMVKLYQTFDPKLSTPKRAKKEITAITVANSEIDFSEFRRAFESRGHTVVSLDSGKTFLDVFPAMAIDLMIISFDTVDLQGSMVLHYLRQTRLPNFPVVLVVPAQQKFPHIQDHIQGFDDCVTWPMEITGFIGKMETLAWRPKAGTGPSPRQGLAG